MVSFRTEEELLQWVNSGPIGAQEQAVALTGIVKGGSVRRFYRILGSEEKSLGVLMEYSQEKEENTFYGEISRFLTDLKVPVPHILHQEPEQGLAILQDLGSTDLHALKELPWPELKAHYVKILEAIQPLWLAGEEQVKSHESLKLMEGFDARLYAWERDYFFDQCVLRIGKDISPESRDALHQECGILQELLLKQAAHLVHRDFQSHNIMITEAGPVFVDFQGMRYGTWFYDLASLLYDPYMNLSENRRDELLAVTAEMMVWPGTDAEFDLHFCAAAVHRLMQALGAYGYLGHELGKEEFLPYIPVAAQELKLLAAEMELTELEQLVKVVLGEKREKTVKGAKDDKSDKADKGDKGDRKRSRSSRNRRPRRNSKK